MQPKIGFPSQTQMLGVGPKAKVVHQWPPPWLSNRAECRREDNQSDPGGSNDYTQQSWNAQEQAKGTPPNIEVQILHI